MDNNKKEEHKIYLDVLKFILCFIVFFSHFNMAFGSDKFGDFSVLKFIIPNPFVDGNLAVCLFLIISNYIYLLKGLSYDDQNYFIKCKSNILNRYVRLLIPAVVVNIFIYILIKFHLFYNITSTSVNHDNVLTWFNIKTWPLFKIIYSTITLCFTRGSVNPPLWCYYFLFLQPLLILLLIPLYNKIDKTICLIICLFVSIILLICQSYWAAVPLTFFLVFLKNKNLIWKIIILLCSILIKIAMKSLHMDSFVFANLIISVAIILILDSLLNRRGISSRNNKRFILNDISFSIYLTHMLFICSIGFYVYENITNNIGIIFLCTFIPMIVLCIPFHYFIEKKLCSTILTVVKRLIDKVYAKEEVICS